MRPEDGERALAVLRARHGILTQVTTMAGDVFDVWDVTCGRDLGDHYDHITTNCSPPRDDRPIDFFFTSEVASIADADGEVLFLPGDAKLMWLESLSGSDPAGSIAPES